MAGQAIPMPGGTSGSSLGLLGAATNAPTDGSGAVYEADPSEKSRTQGGRLDIHEADGQRALADAGLTDEFRAIIHEGAEASRVLDQHGKLLLDAPDDGTGRRPEVLRGDLRRILLDSLPDQTVRWGHKVTGVRPLGDGRHELAFTDGTTVTSGLLIGADGAWSKIRPLLSDAEPRYTGLGTGELA